MALYFAASQWWKTHIVREMVLLSSPPSALTTDVPWYEISYINLSRQIKAMQGKKAVTTEAS